MIRQLLLFIILFLTACSDVSVSSYPTVEVVRVGDGDTITVKQNDSQTAIQLACIDAPELSQQGGKEAANYLKQLISAGKTVGFNPIMEKPDGTIAGEIYRNGNLINLKLVQQGQAVVSDQAVDACSEHRQQLQEAQQRAKSANLGFWSQMEEMPWEYRQQEALTSAGSNGATNSLPNCIDDDCDCFDFSSQSKAQRVLESSAGDPHHLDGDGNGIACDNLD